MASLFGYIIRDSDVKEGGINDAYFLSGISAIAEYPQRINNTFLTKSYDKSGVIAIKAYVRGIETIITIDDYLPFYTNKHNSDNITLVYARPSDQESLWPVFLEKAWAKVMGNYNSIVGGQSGEALDFILGAPTVYQATSKNKSNKQWWAFLKDKIEGKLVMCAGVNDNPTSKKNSKGLHTGHAYSLMQTFNIKDKQGKQHNLY
jgi:hypothetical protein